MRNKKWQWVTLGMALFTGAALSGCSKQASQEEGKKAAEKTAPPAAQKAAKPEAPASKFTIDDVCAKEIAEKRIAYQNDPMSEQGYKDMETNCLESEKEPFKDLKDAAAAEGLYADAVMAACSEKSSTEWAVCWADMKEGAVNKALGK